MKNVFKQRIKYEVMVYLYEIRVYVNVMIVEHLVNKCNNRQ